MFDETTFRSPTDNNDHMHMLTVKFKKQMQYASTKDMTFRMFLTILLITFLSVMALEMRSILTTFFWCLMFPVDSGERGRIIGRDAVTISTSVSAWKARGEVDDPIVSKIAITAVRNDHRGVVAVMTFLRFVLWLFLLWSGVMFLAGPPRYLAMIFDALSLVFIIQIDELLYRTMLRPEYRNDHMEVEEMQVPHWHSGRVDESFQVLGDTFGFILVILFAMAIVYTYRHNELNPVLESLDCLCTADGPRCFEAYRYDKVFWDMYWSTTLPASRVIIDSLQSAPEISSTQIPWR
jgi:hypothetical protein